MNVRPALTADSILSADGLCAVDIDAQRSHPEICDLATTAEISAAARAVLDRCVLRKDVAQKSWSLGGRVEGVGGSNPLVLFISYRYMFLCSFFDLLRSTKESLHAGMPG